MSHVVAIGIGGSPTAIRMVCNLLIQNGFIVFGDADPGDDLVVEVGSKATELRPDYTWTVAVDSEGLADVDMIHRLADEAVHGRLRVVADIATNQSDIVAVAILLYDLGSSRFHAHEPCEVSAILDDLIRMYPEGGPIGTALHEYLRGQ